MSKNILTLIGKYLDTDKQKCMYTDRQIFVQRCVNIWTRNHKTIWTQINKYLDTDGQIYLNTIWRQNLDTDGPKKNFGLR